MSKTFRIKRVDRYIIWAILLILAAIAVIFAYSSTHWSDRAQDKSSQWLNITSKESVIHVGSNDSFATSQEGILAARFVLDFLNTNNPDSAKKAIALYDKLIPIENYGGEYTALQWFCQYLLAPENERQKILSNKFVHSFYDFFADNNFDRLKEYLKRKYKLDTYADQATQAGLDRKAFLEDFILFNNPRREEWEKTSKLIEFLNPKKGTAIADIGSGPGYYTFQFSQLVGDKGQIYAIDTVKNHLNYVKSTSEKFGINNIKTVHTSGDSVELPANSVDVAFLCSLYHNIYAMSRADERDSFVKSINKALRPDGTLYIVDNALVKESELPYHGPYIAKELIVGQLKYYGFHLVKEHTYIPQRYILAFQKD